MAAIFSRANKVIKKIFFSELVRYIIIGGGAVFIDLVVYWMLTANTAILPSQAKRISFLAGGIWSFFGNKFFTFRKFEASIAEPFLFVIIYLIGFVLNTLIHDLVLKNAGIKPAAFMLATLTSIVWNYAGQKWIIFRKKRVE